MKTADCERAIRIVENVFGGMKIKSFLCFGVLLNLVRDNNVNDATDIDFGVFYESFNGTMAIRGFQRFEYLPVKRIINDIDGRLLYVSFKHKTLPPIDIFAWYLHEGIRYHTYDVRLEGRPRPTTYIFKGVEASILPDPLLPNARDKNMVYANFGPRKAPIFRQDIWVPFKYGTLLDRWYPDWLRRRSGQSQSPFVVEMNTCRGWTNKVHIAAQLKASREKYDRILKIL